MTKVAPALNAAAAQQEQEVYTVQQQQVRGAARARSGRAARAAGARARGVCSPLTRAPPQRAEMQALIDQLEAASPPGLAPAPAPPAPADSPPAAAPAPGAAPSVVPPRFRYNARVLALQAQQNAAMSSVVAAVRRGAIARPRRRGRRAQLQRKRRYRSVHTPLTLAPSRARRSTTTCW